MACECRGPPPASSLGLVEVTWGCRVDGGARSLRSVVVVACTGGCPQPAGTCQPLAAHLGPCPIATLVTHHQSRCSSSACQPRVLGAGPALGPAPECSSHPRAAVPHQALLPHLNFCFSAHPPCYPPRTPLQPHLPKQTRGLESQLAASAAPSRGPAPQETECWGSRAGAGPGLPGHGSRLWPSHATAWPLGRSGPGNSRAGRPGSGPCLPASPPSGC